MNLINFLNEKLQINVSEDELEKNDGNIYVSSDKIKEIIKLYNNWENFGGYLFYAKDDKYKIILRIMIDISIEKILDENRSVTDIIDITICDYETLCCQIKSK